jgi:hypothetical protein
MRFLTTLLRKNHVLYKQVSVSMWPVEEDFQLFYEVCGGTLVRRHVSRVCH